VVITDHRRRRGGRGGAATAADLSLTAARTLLHRRPFWVFMVTPWPDHSTRSIGGGEVYMVGSERDERASDLLSALPVAICVAAAPSGLIAHANTAFREMFGAVVSMAGESALTDVAGHQLPPDRLPFARAVAARAPVTVDDLVLPRADGRRTPLRALASPVGGDGERGPRFVTMAFLDVSAEVASASAARDLHRRLGFVLDHAPVMMFALARDGTITLSEGAALKRLGFRPGQLVGRNAMTVYGGRYSAEPIQRALAGEVVNEIINVDGIVLDVWLTPVRDARGEIVEVLGVQTDVTQQRKLQARLIQDDRVRAMGTLAASLAHEINNPLAYILGNLERVDRELREVTRSLISEPHHATTLERVSKTQDLVAQIRTGAERVRQVTGDLRTFMRPDDQTVTAVDLASVVRAVLDLVRKEIEPRAELAVTVGVTPPVEANEARLLQVLLNLLANAWQALPDPDPARHRITLRTWAEDGQVYVEVSDTGPGIVAEDAERIFEPFYSTRDVGTGTGLGLFVCRNIVADMGGEVTYHPRDGKGAAFRVRLPASRQPPRPEPTPLPRPTRLDGRRRRVVVIDDDHAVAQMLAASLEEEFEVRVIHDSTQAIELLTQAEFDLAYCDLMMQGLTGVDIYEQLETRAPSILQKLVFMTGGAFTRRTAAFTKRLPEQVIYKPFDIVGETRRRLPQT
jgi:PAS domain S-box-containing protein